MAFGAAVLGLRLQGALPGECEEVAGSPAQPAVGRELRLDVPGTRCPAASGAESELPVSGGRALEEGQGQAVV